MKAQLDRVIYMSGRGQSRDIAGRLQDLLGVQFDPIEGMEATYAGAGVEITEPPEGVDLQGLWGFALRVPDLDAAKAELAAKGLQPIFELVVGKVREAVYNPEDTKGVQFALCEYPESAPNAAVAAAMK